VSDYYDCRDYEGQHNPLVLSGTYGRFMDGAVDGRDLLHINVLRDGGRCVLGAVREAKADDDTESITLQWDNERVRWLRKDFTHLEMLLEMSLFFEEQG
jgi:hypothetical protein